MNILQSSSATHSQNNPSTHEKIRLAVAAAAIVIDFVDHVVADELNNRPTKKGTTTLVSVNIIAQKQRRGSLSSLSHCHVIQTHMIQKITTQQRIMKEGRNGRRCFVAAEKHDHDTAAKIERLNKEIEKYI